MKKTILVILSFCAIFGILWSVSFAAKSECTTIKDWTLLTSEGEIIPLWYIKEWPRAWYNYQAHMYNWDYYGNWGNLIMKWNDAWLSNKDCDGDSLLDRHYGFDSYIGSSAWLTNHEIWTNDDGSTSTYFIKIVAAPADAYLEWWVWYTSEGVEIGPVIWGQFAIIQEVYNDPISEAHGLLFKSEFNPGLGSY